MQKKILILAGSYFQIPVIEYANKQGHYVITCDNRPDNPGHKIADEYVNVSTVDLDGVLAVARQKQIDGILAYGTDPAAPTAAFVSEKLGLPGNKLLSVERLSNKRLFRKFLAENKFNVPDFKTFKSLKEAKAYAVNHTDRLFIKPVDSSGSKGVSLIVAGDSFEQLFENAMFYSRSGEVIIESVIERKGPHIHGEAFVYKGKIEFLLLGDQYFSNVNPCAPVSTTLPSLEHLDIMNNISLELDRLIGLIGYKTGGLNIEIIRDNEDRIFFVEIGARNGGNLMPELAKITTGFNMAAANVNAVLNEPIDFSWELPENAFCTQVILHSHENRRYFEPNIEERFNKYELSRLLYYSRGDMVNKYNGSQDVIGIILYRFDSKEICKDLISFISSSNLVTLY